MGLPALRKLLDEAGIEKVELEFLSNWWTSGAERDASDQVRDDLFDAAPLLGVTTIKAGAQLTAFGSTEPVDGDLFAESFDALASDAGRHGLRVAVEPMPMSNLKTVVDGVELVTAVDNPHGGLVVDTWHVRRGDTLNEALPDVLPMSGSSSSSWMTPMRRSSAASGTTRSTTAAIPARAPSIPRASSPRCTAPDGPATGAWRSFPTNSGRSPSPRPSPTRRRPPGLPSTPPNDGCPKPDLARGSSCADTGTY